MLTIVPVTLTLSSKRKVVLNSVFYPLSAYKSLCSSFPCTVASPTEQPYIQNDRDFSEVQQNRRISHLDTELNNSTDFLRVTTFCTVEHVPFRLSHQLSQQTLKIFRITKDYARSWILLACCKVWWLASWMRLCLRAGIWEFSRTSLLQDCLMLGTYKGLLISRPGDSVEVLQMPVFSFSFQLQNAVFHYLTEPLSHYRGIYFRFLAVKRDLHYFQSVHTDSGAQPSFYSMGTGGFLSRVKAAERWSWPLHCV